MLPSQLVPNSNTELASYFQGVTVDYLPIAVFRDSQSSSPSVKFNTAPGARLRPSIVPTSGILDLVRIYQPDSASGNT